MSIPVEHDDPINARILEISEDLVSGFQRKPFHLISEQSEIELETVIERIKHMLEAGVIRRVRQTLLSTKLAHGALCAWKIDNDKIDDAFDFMYKEDPFSGHVVIRSTDREITGSDFKLWTTIKVPQGESLEDHANTIKNVIGAEKYILMPAKGVFTLGVGHVRRKNMPIGSRSDSPAEMMTTKVVELSPTEWDVLLSLKEELTVEEICPDPWTARAEKLNISLEEFFKVAETLNAKKVIGRFSTFLEHTKPSSTGKRVTRFNGLFHWRVEEGMQLKAGSEIGRHHILTHCYWREGGDNFGNVNIMGVVHGTDKNKVLEHKQAIDSYLNDIGIEVLYTNVFWGGRSEIKPSEISPDIYKKWHEKYD
ncbi:MAG: Lrp/AsnC family transcriptional regulator [Verrucomicrobiota bacterium]|nr:Lrp/AsnC family transcriptional regulator [Verrucomicrobiota bacterium]MED5470143.1 Lrp/AsnC family transcriptional regulator [Verrucomicrobiota bacterium]MEE2967551.1 Lrp/AsnC family transcriptional regulator [Verrucomicrobiota bacterium]